MSRSLQKSDFQFPTDLLESSSADTSIHDGAALGAKSDQIPNCFADDFVVGHCVRGESWYATTKAVHLARLASLLFLDTTGLQEGNEIAPLDQNWPLFVDGWQSLVDPCADSVPMFAKSVSHFRNRIVPMNLD